ncbi:hypothetical protein [Limnoglobus roseus]|uniref:hypothetical protein n=1 Tax=Limnoglobus roseus TaxID=2598579 RepID=UPI001C49C63B|nr:hypothetical protein [Limnoglobus roseus]
MKVIDKDNKWPVPLVELRTTGEQRFVSDNAGVIALDAPDLMGRESWFTVVGHGYEVPKDGFGYRGVKLTPVAGKTLTVEVTRVNVAKRIGRLTGGGLFAESQKCGDEAGWKDSPIIGCDSVQTAVLGGKRFWFWGDTTLPGYPLGIFDMLGATTPPLPFTTFEPPLRPKFDYLPAADKPRAVAKMPGSGPTWVFGVTTVPNALGATTLVGSYTKIENHLTVRRAGLCWWNSQTGRFEEWKEIWTKGDSSKPPPMPDGNAVAWTDPGGKAWRLFGNPLPHLKCAATFEAWQDPKQWERLTPEKLKDADGKAVVPHTGGIAFHPWRGRWVAVFSQKFGTSAFGEIWYAEADSPLGPWGTAVKVLTHDNYTFYNTRLHADLTPKGSPVLLFEGTYTAEFAKSPPITPRYNYNQILYRLDLDDPRLEKAKR